MSKKLKTGPTKDIIWNSIFVCKICVQPEINVNQRVLIGLALKGKQMCRLKNKISHHK